MITIIHGNDTASSRKYYIDQKTADAFSFEGEKVCLTDLTQVLEGGGLFTDSKKIFIDEFLSKRKQGKETEEIILLLNKYRETNDIFLWEGKEISKKNASLFSNPTVKTFKFPLFLFTFLDGIKPKSSNNVVLFHEALKKSEAELIFFMLIRQFRLLLAVSDEKSPFSRHAELDSASLEIPKSIRQAQDPEYTEGQVRDDSNQRIDEIKRLAPWQKSKFKKQSGLFSLINLKNAYKKLFEIDLGQKTGTLNMSIEQAIDIFLLDL